MPNEYSREPRVVSPRLTGTADRAKQFIPFAALRGFYDMVAEAAAATQTASDVADETSEPCVQTFDPDEHADVSSFDIP